MYKVSDYLADGVNVHAVVKQHCRDVMSFDRVRVFLVYARFSSL